MISTQKVLTIKQVAEFLQVSTDTAYRLATSGELQGRKIGRIWRFPSEAVRQYLWEHQVSGAKGTGNDPG